MSGRNQCQNILPHVGELHNIIRIVSQDESWNIQTCRVGLETIGQRNKFANSIGIIRSLKVAKTLATPLIKDRAPTNMVLPSPLLTRSPVLDFLGRTATSCWGAGANISFLLAEVL